MKPPRVAILGAGITGLATARELLRGGAQVELFEAAAGEGGLAGTVQHAEFAFDHGPHELVTDDPALLALLHEVAGPDLLRVRKRTAQFFEGKMLRYPFKIGDVLRGIRPGLLLRVLFEVGLVRLRNLFARPRDDSFASWTRARFGPTLWRIYFGPYTQKVWGVPPEQIDASTAQHRIAVDSLSELARRALRFTFGRAERHHRTHDEFLPTFLYTRGGIGTLQRRLRAEVEQRGGRLRFGARVTRLRSDGVRVHGIECSDGTAEGGFDAVVSTLPLPVLVQLALPDEAAALLRGHPLAFRGLLFVFVALAQPQVTEHHWIYFPGADVPFQRWTEFVHFEAGMCPPGTTGLAFELAADPGDPLWQRSDAELVALCLEHAARLAPLRPDALLHSHVARVPCAYPLQTRGYAAHADALLDAVARLENLVSLGRQGLFRYCNQDECLAMALEVAPRLLAGERGIRYGRPSTWRGAHAEPAPV